MRKHKRAESSKYSICVREQPGMRECHPGGQIFWIIRSAAGRGTCDLKVIKYPRFGGEVLSW